MDTPRLLIFGGTGFLGRHLAYWALALKGWGVDATYFTTSPPADGCDWHPCDILDRPSVEALISRVQPTIVINAAYRQSGDRATEICADGAGNVASAAGPAGARVVHISTDLVFDGSLGRPYREDDPVSPIGDYGLAKVDGEQQVLAADPTALVVRTSLIYGDPTAPQEQLVRRAIQDGGISFFTDEWRTPVGVRLLADAVGRLAGSDIRGVLHVAGHERVNRLEFAQILAVQLGLDPAKLRGREQDPALGPRAKDVSLDTSLLTRIYGGTLPGPSETLR